VNLLSTLEIYAGGPPGKGPGSGNYPRLLHMTDIKNLTSILKKGIVTERAGAKAVHKGWEKSRNVVYAFENKEHAPDIKWTLENNLNPNNTIGLGKKQVVVEFSAAGKVKLDHEYDDYDTYDGRPFSAVLHTGSVPSKNITGYYEVKRSGGLGRFTSVKG
jgi:hypothetical protein